MPRGKRVPGSLPHQLTGTQFLREHKQAALFDEQGLGKSKQLIDAIVAEVAAGSIGGALIVCPNGLKSNWEAEIARFSSLPCAVFGSGRKARRVAFQSLRAAFYIINYEAVAAELPSLRALLRFKPMALVLDESHRIKTPDSKVARAVHHLRGEAARRYLLTGTPVANKPEDLWSQIFFLDDGHSLGRTFEEFREQFLNVDGGYQKLDVLRERIATLSLRRTKAAAVELPNKIHQRVIIDLAPEQQRLYAQLRDELELWVRSLSGGEVLKHAEAIFTRMIRLAQLASNPALVDTGYTETPAKFAALDKLMASYTQAAHQKVIFWTSFVPNIAALAQRYARLKPSILHGEMSILARDRAVTAFRTDPEVRLMIANPAAAREGLTLTEANVAIYLDRTFNLVDYLQSQDRIHRISQTRDCEIVLLIARDTIDEFIDFTLEQKHRLAGFVQGDADEIAAADIALEKPDVLLALLGRGRIKEKNRKSTPRKFKTAASDRSSGRRK
jgi:SWI/SNF-related matrix-associated actin-dependent regulator 1 of chromatin subfamily A